MCVIESCKIIIDDFCFAEVPPLFLLFFFLLFLYSCISFLSFFAFYFSVYHRPTSLTSIEPMDKFAAEVLAKKKTSQRLKFEVHSEVGSILLREPPLPEWS
jgi:hypothetical protein